jgi:sugar O-acyltransferase (sialic acid O-acetyltransferase NeuD family)
MITDYMNIQFMSTKNKVIIFGTKDLADLAHYYLLRDTEYEIVGFTTHKDYISEKFFSPRNSVKKYPIIPFDDIEKTFPPNDYLLFAPMTGVKMNSLRKKIYEEGKSKGYQFISYISPKATICDNIIGENCFILEDNTIQPFTSIGNNVVMWSGNHIGHHSFIEDHVFFTSQVVLSGHCHVKERAWFGINSSIRDFTTIGEGSLIAMGSLITKSTEENSFYMGVPAKKQDKKAIEVY